MLKKKKKNYLPLPLGSAAHVSR